MGRRVTVNQFFDAGAHKQSDKGKPSRIMMSKIDMDDPEGAALLFELHNNKERYSIMEKKTSISSVTNKVIIVVTYKDFEHPDIVIPQDVEENKNGE